MLMDAFLSAVNTLKASRWDLFRARIFGKRFVGLDRSSGQTCVVSGYHWRGKWHMTDCEWEKHSNDIHSEER